MSRFRQLPSRLIGLLAVLIAWLERRGAKKSSAGESEAASIAKSQSAAPGGSRSPKTKARAEGDAAEAESSGAAAREGATPPAATKDVRSTADVGAGQKNRSATDEDRSGTTGGSTAVEDAFAPPLKNSGSSHPIPAGSIEGDGTPVCPPDYPIKGNATSRIYHQPGQSSYERTVAEFCFATEEDAIAAGFRAPLR
ncbi:MAG: hypothetical protein H0W59_08985 [Chloroflexia bacterium]|nr:hypothetical protein [Chloroflexia bacterium]